MLPKGSEAGLFRLDASVLIEAATMDEADDTFINWISSGERGPAFASWTTTEVPEDER